jgi:hypothetical protein
MPPNRGQKPPLHLEEGKDILDPRPNPIHFPDSDLLLIGFLSFITSKDSWSVADVAIVPEHPITGGNQTLEAIVVDGHVVKASFKWPIYPYNRSISLNGTNYFVLISMKTTFTGFLDKIEVPRSYRRFPNWNCSRVDDTEGPPAVIKP